MSVSLFYTSGIQICSKYYTKTRSPIWLLNSWQPQHEDQACPFTLQAMKVKKLSTSPNIVFGFCSSRSIFEWSSSVFEDENSTKYCWNFVLNLFLMLPYHRIKMQVHPKEWCQVAVAYPRHWALRYEGCICFLSVKKKSCPWKRVLVCAMGFVFLFQALLWTPYPFTKICFTLRNSQGFHKVRDRHRFEKSEGFVSFSLLLKVEITT